MFVYSIKSSKKKIIAMLCAVTLATAALIFVLARSGEPTASSPGINLKAESAAERIAFISQYGWEISEDPVEVSEVIIPAEFDEEYVQYNEMQTEQGFDLEPYKGMRAKRWTYEVLNFPKYEGKEGVIELNLLVYDGRVIGGDVCSLELGGFMQGFDFPEIATVTVTAESTTAAVGTPAAETTSAETTAAE